jgi:hypothetical protein
MYKSLPFLLVFVPIVLVLVGMFFRVANPKRFLLAAVIYTATTVGVGYFAHDPKSSSLMWLYMVVVLTIMSPWVIPWAGALMSFATPPLPGPAPAQKATEATKKVYDDLTPEQKEALKRAGATAFRAGARHFADTLRQKGKSHLADGLDEIVR